MNQFDVVFSNPPYNKGMDLKIVEAVIPFTQKMVVVMTQRLLTRRVLQKKRMKYSPIIQKVLFIEDSWGLFSITHFAKQCVYIFNKNKQNKQVNLNNKYYLDSLNDYSELGILNEEQKQFINNLKKTKVVKNNIIDNCTKQYLKEKFKIAYYIAGGAGQSNNKLAKIIPKQKDHTIYPNTNIKPPTKKQLRFYLYFNNLQQLEDFKHTYSNVIFRWYLSFFKSAHTISDTLLIRIPFIKGRLENKDWKQILGIPDSLYEKILKKYEQV